MCFGGRRAEDEYKKSREIDAMIHRDEKEMAKVVKLLLLGKPLCADIQRATLADLAWTNHNDLQVPERAVNRRY
jgi:hypothetical protein